MWDNMTDPMDFMPEDNNATIPCLNHEYDTSVWKNTIITQYDLVGKTMNKWAAKVNAACFCSRFATELI